MTTDISARYQHAAKIMQFQGTNDGFRNDMVIAHWIERSDCFFYLRQTEAGVEFRLVSAGEATNDLAFDHEALAGALSALSGEYFDAEDLSALQDVTMTLNPVQVRFKASRRYWAFDVEAKVCGEVDAPHEYVIQEGYDPTMGYEIKHTQRGLVSPDGKKALFTRDCNLWICHLETGAEEALTTDGEEDYRYAVFGAPLLDSLVQASWSPDSRRVFTYQFDARDLRDRPTIHYVPDDGSLAPKVYLQKGLAYPGDEIIETQRMVIIDVDKKKTIDVDFEQIPLSPFGYGMFTNYSRQYGWWSKDGSKAYFVALTRGCRKVRLVEVEPQTGATRNLHEEASDTFVRLMPFVDGNPCFVPMPDSGECLWYSERSGYGHLYLYDLKTGELKREITAGDWHVRDVVHYCPKRREIILQTMGRTDGISPYYKDICKINIDTGVLTELATGDRDHYLHQPYDIASFRCATFFNAGYRGFSGSSPEGDYFVFTRSRVDTIPESVLIDRDGNEILVIETCDVSDLPDKWNWPIPVKTISADGESDIYGAVFLPPDYDPRKRYPVIDYSGSCRLIMHTPVGAFGNSHCVHSNYFLYPIAWASLGFVVVTLEGRGTAGRSKAFSDYKWGDPRAANDLSDRVEGIKQLSKTYSGMDLQRVGIVGPEADTNVIFGLIDHSDFYKVCVLNFFSDPRIGIPLFAETYEGVPIPGEEAQDVEHAEDCVEVLKGKLLLIDGMRNGLGGTFRLVDALEKAGKPFEMVTYTRAMQDPNGTTVKRSWDYMIEHLLDEEPQKQFVLRTAIEVLHDKLAAEARKNRAEAKETVSA